MDHVNLKADKSLGQHFLINQGACQKIINLLDIHPDDQIIEIGPGKGALSRPLSATEHEYILFLEKDYRWGNILPGLIQAKDQIVLMDALRFNWKKLTGKWKVTGNLPYNVASPLIWDIVSHTRSLQKAVFMVQREVGERLAAKPGGKKYGALSVWTQSFTRPKLEFILRPGSFQPPPKVDSAVISFEPLSKRPEHAVAGKLKRLLDICFHQRRKQLKNIFRQAGLDKLLEASGVFGVKGEMRPEMLDSQQFLAMAELWEKMDPNTAGEDQPD